MKKIIGVILLMLVLFAAANYAFAESESEIEMPWVEINAGISPFVYSDQLLMVDENHKDPDIAKIAAALSSAAYDAGICPNWM